VLLILTLNVGAGVTRITGTVALVDSITAEILLLLGGSPGGLGRDFGLLPLPGLGPLPVTVESCLGTLTSWEGESGGEDSTGLVRQQTENKPLHEVSCTVSPP